MTAVARADRTVAVIAISDIVSGVDSWVRRLENAFRGHRDHELRVLVCNRETRIGAAAVASSPRRVRRYLEETRPDLVLPNYAWPVLRAVARLSRERDVRIIGHCHSDSAEEYYNPLAWYEPVIAHFVAVSADCDAELRRRLPDRAGDVTRMPYGVVVAPPRAGRGPGPLRIVYAGRLQHEQKRVLDLAPLAEELARRGVEFRLTVAGDGPERGALERALAAWSERVRFTGAVDACAVTELLRESDVLVQLSEFEGTSNSMLEAMAQGAVPVVTRTSGTGDVLTDGENGFVADVGATGRIAARLAELAGDPERLRAMGAAASRRAADFSIDDNVTALAEIFDRVLREPVRRWPAGKSLRPRAAVKEGVFVPRRFRRVRHAVRRWIGSW